MSKMMKHLDEKWKNRVCAACNTLPRNWESDGLPYLMPGYSPFGQAGNAVAAVHFACSNCGHIELFAANRLGVMPKITVDEQGNRTIELPNGDDDGYGEVVDVQAVKPAEMDPLYVDHGTDANGSPVVNE